MKRSEVWLIDLEPTRGDEIKKTRPVVIVSSDAVGKLALKIIVPFTDWKDKHARVRWLVRVEPTQENGLTKISAADTFQVRSVAEERFVRQLGVLSEAEMDAISDALAIVLKIRR
jgi:mRNA interferase MazF